MNKVMVSVTNRIARITSNFDREELVPFWSYSAASYRFVIRAKPFLRKCKTCNKWEKEHEYSSHEYEPIWDGREHLLQDNELPAGLFWATRKEIEEKLNIKFKVSGDLEYPILNANGLKSDRDYQNQCVEKMLKVVRFGGGLVLSATGTGKTRTVAVFFSRIKGSAVFVVDQLLLLEQARNELAEVLGEKVGYVGDSIFDPQRITVATIQTMFLHRKKEAFRKWTRQLEVMILDEIHEMMAQRNFSVVEQIEPLAVFGLTATLALKKKMIRIRAHAITGPVIFEFPLEQGQKEGFLAQGTAVRLLFTNRMTQAEQKASGWGKLYTEKIVEHSERNWLISEIIKVAHSRGKYIIVLVTRVKHLKLLSDRLKDIPHKVVSGTFNGKDIKVQERMESKAQFEAGDIRLIIANTVFKKGVNTKRLDFIIDAAASRSENDPVQKFGRGIRQHKEKSGLIYFDLNDWDEENKQNYFHKASRYRARSLQRAGIDVHKIVWQEGLDLNAVIDRAESWLQKRLR